LINTIRSEFPILSRTIGDHTIAYLDNASTTPKPKRVIDAVVRYYTEYTANVHRGVHLLGEEASRAFEATRTDLASLLGAKATEIVFTRGTTEAINLVAAGLRLTGDDEVVFPASEHHANWLPWRVRARPVVLGIDADGVPRWDELERLLTPRTKLISVGHVSNVTGTIAPVKRIVELARARRIPVLLDAAQSLSHLAIDVADLGVDFAAMSAHKAFGPSGVGALWVREGLLEDLALYQVGGGMVALNEEGGWTAKPGLARFEAGTPNIEGVIGFGEAIRFLRDVGLDKIRAHDVAMSEYLVTRLRAIKGVRVLAADHPIESRIALATFLVDAPAMTQESVARALSDLFGVCVSGGYHCTHVLHKRACPEGTVRASPHVFNTRAEIDRLVEGVEEIAG
jgi:cysteine desulfurase/selenocysteine lyase